MLTCLPLSICSWNFRVLGLAGGTANLTFNWFTEQGTMEYEGTEYAVVKHGWLSGHWTLEGRDEVVYNGQKTSALTRTFEIQGDDLLLTLQAQSVFTRCFELLDEGEPVGTIYPKHPFTRRSFVNCEDSIPELAQLFAFWLVVITWKRSAQNNNRNP